MRDRGQAAIVVVSVSAALLGSSLVAAVHLGDQVLDRRTAQRAADAAALAGVGGGAAAARRIAAANGATLRSFTGLGGDGVVTLEGDDATPSARASRPP